MSNTKQLNEAKLAEKIKKISAAFKAATPAQKRVIIAQDVIDNIKSKKFYAQQGAFVRSPEIERMAYDVAFLNNTDQSLQKILVKDMPKCTVCALGGMMLSCTLHNNQSKLSDFDHDFSELGCAIEDNEKLSNGFNRIFSKAQLALIEVAFEMGDGYFGNDEDSERRQFFCGVAGISKKKYEAAVAFGERFDKSEPWLIGIMKNIIANEGTFNP